MKETSLVTQSHNLGQLLEHRGKNYFASGLIVTIRDLSGKYIIDETCINGEYSEKLFDSIIKLLHLTLSQSVATKDVYLREAKNILDKSNKIINKVG